ncbi:unnamed protein product [Hyaloperonospora brassicae]|uniref:Uncharacterized protein n=1 Tax=Hyaloperonospora brassicae TaxID=162125 RepID=A0AAV0TCC7_HYABA|nr:unnamed protein product [Hyaloperonospora brassicae]
MGTLPDPTMDSINDTSASQDVQTLVPLSLNLVAKKEQRLQRELTQLDEVLSQRHETLCALRERHEHVLTTNGQLQERRRVHWEKLVALRAQLGDDARHAHEERGTRAGTRDVIGGNELQATAEKCRVLQDVVRGLLDKHTALERQCMGREDQLARATVALTAKAERLKIAQNTLCLMRQDTHSTLWNLELDQAALAKADSHLEGASQRAQQEAAVFDKVDHALKLEKAALDDLEICWQNYEGMAHEEQRQLIMANEDATSEKRELQKLLESNGPTCPTDEEVLQLAKELQTQLQHVNDEVANTKFYKRELALRRKQEKEWLVFTQSSIKAKDEQLLWLERQRKHLENELKEVQKAHDADEAAYQAFLNEHKAAVGLHDGQMKDAEKQLKTTERAIVACNKKVAAATKKAGQKTKVLAELTTKLAPKQEQLEKSTATQTLVDAEILSVQSTLDQALLNVERTQQLRIAHDMESEKLRSSCTKLESEVQHTHQTLTTLSNSIAVAQTAVKNHTDEVRDKFLGTFVTDDAGVLIDLLDKEIKQKYNETWTAARRKYGRILLQKETQYNAMVAKKIDGAVACNTQRTNMNAYTKESMCGNHIHAVSAIGPDPAIDSSMDISASENGCEDNETEVQQTNPSRAERPSNDATASKDTKLKKCLVKPRQRKTKGVQKLVPKSARRQLAPGLNLAEESPQTDKELTDVLTTDSAAVVVPAAKATRKDGSHSAVSRQHKRSGTRQPRLKRRTPAQKAGKPARIASITPTLPSTSDASTISSAQANPAADMASQDSLESQMRCDSAREASQRTRITEAPTKTAEQPQVAVTKPQVVEVHHARICCAPLHQRLRTNSDFEQMGPLCDNMSTGRTATKAPHRSRVSKPKKVSRISLGRSHISGSIVDWSAADTFSFD